jgi:hypothetical protein
MNSFAGNINILAWFHGLKYAPMVGKMSIRSGIPAVFLPGAGKLREQQDVSTGCAWPVANTVSG